MYLEENNCCYQQVQGSPLASDDDSALDTGGHIVGHYTHNFANFQQQGKKQFKNCLNSN